MNDVTVFWPAFWSGFGLGLVVALGAAVLSCVVLVGLADRYMDEDTEAASPRLRILNGGKS